MKSQFISQTVLRFFSMVAKDGLHTDDALSLSRSVTSAVFRLSSVFDGATKPHKQKYVAELEQHVSKVSSSKDNWEHI